MFLPDNYPCYEKIYHEDDDPLSYPNDTATHHQQQHQQQQQSQHHIYQQQENQQRVYHHHHQHQQHQQQQSVSQQQEKFQYSTPLLHTNIIEQDLSERLRIARQYIDEIIDDCIPYIEKTAYIEHLLELETNPLWFLQYENWNIWNAAQRIVKYWEWKRVAFGEDRTFRYIHDLSGSGSLSEYDLMIIRTGMATLLPKYQYGSTVMLFNRYRTTDAIDWDTLDGTQKLRFTFFWFSKVVQDMYNNHNISNNMNINRRISTSDDSYDNDNDDGVGKLLILYVILSFVKVPSRNFRDMVTEAMPIRIVNTFVIFHPSQHDMFTLSRHIIPSFLKFHAPIVKFANLYPCCCSSSYDVADKLLSTNTLNPSSLHKHGIPIEFGGTWSYDNHYQWFDYSTSIMNHDRYYRNPTYFIQQQETQQQEPHQHQEQPSMMLTVEHRHFIPQQQHEQQYKLNHQQQEQVLFHKHDTGMIDEVLPPDMLMTDDHIDDNFHSEIDIDEMMMITPDPIRHTQQIQQQDETIVNLSSSSSTPYWILRHQLFAERSHLSPIDIDGGGTLCQEDLKILKTGCLMILPNTKIGQRVCYMIQVKIW